MSVTVVLCHQLAGTEKQGVMPPTAGYICCCTIIMRAHADVLNLVTYTDWSELVALLRC